MSRHPAAAAARVRRSSWRAAWPAHSRARASVKQQQGLVLCSQADLQPSSHLNADAISHSFFYTILHGCRISSASRLKTYLVLVHQVAGCVRRLSVGKGQHPVPVHQLPAQVAVRAGRRACPQHLKLNTSH